MPAHQDRLPPSPAGGEGGALPRTAELGLSGKSSFLFLKRSHRFASYSPMLNRGTELPLPPASPKPKWRGRRPSGPAESDILADRRRGRGAQTNISGRYEPKVREAFDDEWGSLEELPALKTEVQVERARKIITRNQSPDISFDRSINPYRGCEHGCSYCFARPTHANMGLSPGPRFRDEALRQAGRGEAPGEGAGRARLRAAHHRDRHQHRSLPADRARMARHAADPRSAVEGESPGRHRDEVGAGHARHRHPRLDGRARARQGGAVADHARPPARARHGAARRDAAEAAGDDGRSSPPPAFRSR